MAMFFKNIIILFLTSGFLISANYSFAMGGKPETTTISSSQLTSNIPTSNITLKELAHIYWPDSNATELQQEEILKKILGKRVNWQITVAQIQRNGIGYLVQGQSDKDMLGTFSYIKPRSKADEEKIIKSSMGDKLDITGIVKDMEMRHIVLDPANLANNAE